MRLRSTSAASARNPGSIPIKIEEFLGRKPWEGSGQFLGLSRGLRAKTKNKYISTNSRSTASCGRYVINMGNMSHASNIRPPKAGDREYTQI